MRKAAGFLHSLLAERPRLVPFLPVVGRRLFHRGSADGVRLPAVRRGRTASLRPPEPPTGLTVFSIIRNGIANGYPFIEAYGVWLRDADRIVLVDGESDDGTAEALAELTAIAPHVKVVSRPWPAADRGGSAIAELTQAALDLARPGARRLAYVQADEVFTPEQRVRMRAAAPAALEFAGCINFWNSFHTVVENDFPMRYVRAFPADESIQSIGDGFSFDLGSTPLRRTPEEILHYGWCFPVNILQKHVAHSLIYRGNLAYAARGWLARLMLEQGRFERRLLDALAPHYRPAPFRGKHPQAVQHLLSLPAYDPNPGLDLLRSGADW